MFSSLGNSPGSQPPVAPLLRARRQLFGPFQQLASIPGDGTPLALSAMGEEGEPMNTLVSFPNEDRSTRNLRVAAQRVMRFLVAFLL